MQSRLTRLCLLLTGVIAAAGCRADTEIDSEAPVPFSNVFVLEETVRLETDTDDPLGFPSDVAVWNGRVTIADAFGQNVKAFDPDGALAMTIGRLGDGPGEFRYPVSLVADADGRLAVLDPLHSAVSVFGPDGSLIDDAGFRFGGAVTGGMLGLNGGEHFLIGTRLVDQRGQFNSEYIAHLFDQSGQRLESFGPRPEHTHRNESPFMGMRVAVIDDSIAVWGIVGRRNLYFHPLVPGATPPDPVDSVYVPGLSPFEWEQAPEGDEALWVWASEREKLSGIVPIDGYAIARFVGGDTRRGEGWYRYAFVSTDEMRTVAVTGRTEHMISHVHEGRAIGVRIDEHGDAYLARFRIVDHTWRRR